MVKADISVDASQLSHGIPCLNWWGSVNHVTMW